jgi:hypothetical protein
MSAILYKPLSFWLGMGVCITLVSSMLFPTMVKKSVMYCICHPLRYTYRQ